MFISAAGRCFSMTLHAQLFTGDSSFEADWPPLRMGFFILSRAAPDPEVAKLAPIVFVHYRFFFVKMDLSVF
jgi:hypothetical protein